MWRSYYVNTKISKFITYDSFNTDITYEAAWGVNEDYYIKYYRQLSLLETNSVLGLTDDDLYLSVI